MDDGYTKEEHKMINETRKILNKPDLHITATAVRVPIVNCHGESINVEFENDFDLYDVKMLLQNSPGIIVNDNPEKNNILFLLKQMDMTKFLLVEFVEILVLNMALTCGLLQITLEKVPLLMQYKF